MQNEFVPYKLAVKLKELGFDEECLGIYSKKRKLYIEDLGFYNSVVLYGLTAPLWQQAFDWCLDMLKKDYYFRIIQDSDSYSLEKFNNGQSQYIVSDVTREFLLTKLIEIVENEKRNKI